MTLTAFARSFATGRRRRPSTSRSTLKAIIKGLTVADDVRAFLRQRLELMGHGSGDRERFPIDRIPKDLLSDHPDLEPFFMDGIERIRLRHRGHRRERFTTEGRSR